MQFYWLVFRRGLRDTLNVFGWSYGGSIATALGGLIGIYYQSLHAPGAALDQLSSWIDYGLKGAGSAFLFCLVFNLLRAPALLYAEAQVEIGRLKDSLVPRLLVEAANKGNPLNIYLGNVFPTQSNDKTSNLPQVGGDYVGLACTNVTTALLEQCEAFITSIEPIGTPEEVAEFWRSKDKLLADAPVEPIPLQWVDEDKKKHRADIPAGSSRRLLVFNSRNNKLWFCTDSLPLNAVYYFKQGLSYLATISIASRSAPATMCKIKVTWGNAISLEIVSKA